MLFDAECEYCSTGCYMKTVSRQIFVFHLCCKSETRAEGRRQSKAERKHCNNKMENITEPSFKWYVRVCFFGFFACDVLFLS